MPAAPESPRSPSATAKPGGHGGGSTAHAPKKIATVDTGASKPAPVATVAAKRPATTR
jgi:hypothetical protein